MSSKQTFQKCLQSTQDTLLYSLPFHISCTSSLTHHLHPHQSSPLLSSLPKKDPAEVKVSLEWPRVDVVEGLLLQ